MLSPWPSQHGPGLSKEFTAHSIHLPPFTDLTFSHFSLHGQVRSVEKIKSQRPENSVSVQRPNPLSVRPLPAELRDNTV